MIVVADTSPLNYLILIDAIHVLPMLYGRVFIPSEVHRELRQPRAPLLVREWAEAPPSWCEVKDVRAAGDTGLELLDAGERDAIHLALGAGIDTVLMDESDGRREAVRLNLRVTGTLGVLEIAAQRGLLAFETALNRLEKTNFRLSARVRDEFQRRSL